MPLGRICSRAGGALCTTCGRTCRLDNERRNRKSVDHGVKRSRFLRLRAAALHRDGDRCRFKFEGCTVIATTVHVNAQLQGDHDQATLADCTSACAHCHGVVDQPRSSPPRP